MGLWINRERGRTDRRNDVTEQLYSFLILLQYGEFSLPGGAVDSFVSGIEGDLIHTLSDINRTQRARDRVQHNQFTVFSGGKQSMGFRIDSQSVRALSWDGVDQVAATEFGAGSITIITGRDLMFWNTLSVIGS
jgi:hypothetical protein